jgi:laminin alpha 3/5
VTVYTLFVIELNEIKDIFLYLFIWQSCDLCDPTNPERSHPPEYAIDGTENWWQSPPLSRGMKYNEVNLTIDFGQVSQSGK